MSVDPELSNLIDDLKDLERDAKALARSGHPGVRAEGQRALKEISQEIRRLARLADAEL